MIYVQLRARVKLAQGETLHVADAAKVLGSEKPGIAPSSAQPPPASTRWMPSPLPRRSKKFFHRRTFPSSVRMSATSTASRRAARIFCALCGRRRRC